MPSNTVQWHILCIMFFNNEREMKTVLNILSIVFVLGWLLGVVMLTDRILIHILLVLAIFSLVMSLLSEEEPAQ